MEETYSISENKILASTFGWMFLGLLSTALVAAITYSTGLVMEVASAWLPILLVQLLIAFAFHGVLVKFSPMATTFLFFLYSMLTGLTFSVIFAAFDLGTIAYALFATAGFFGIIALIGYNSKSDFNVFGSILMATLIVAIILTVVNIFVGSREMDIALDWVVLALFAGFTAYDTNKIKMMAQSGFNPEKVAIYGAMQLYLDFINMFLRILSIISRRRD